jgi:hypothetical protein
MVDSIRGCVDTCYCTKTYRARLYIGMNRAVVPSIDLDCSLFMFGARIGIPGIHCGREKLMGIYI